MLREKLPLKLLYVIPFGIFLAIAFGRIRKSFDHLPVDPGYEFFEDTYRFGPSAILKSEGGYLDIPRRLIAEVVTQFSIRQTGMIGSIIWILMVSFSAMLVMVIMKRIHPSKGLAFVCGLSVVIAPSASESQIGNQSVVKWFLILLAIIVVSLPEASQVSSRDSAFLVLLSGVSNPLTFLAAAPLGLSLVQRKIRLNDSRVRLIIGAFFVGFLIQLLSWKSTGVGLQKYESRTYSLWPGAGAFWYYNMIIPPLTCAAFLVRASLPEWSWCPKPSRFIVNISLTGLLLFLLTYWLSGIGDRYFVVPQILAFIAVATYTVQHFEAVNFILRVSLAISLAVFFRASVKWFDAGWFLSNGPKWSEQIDKAITQCGSNSDQVIKLEQSLGTTDLPCSAILSRS